MTRLSRWTAFPVALTLLAAAGSGSLRAQGLAVKAEPPTILTSCGQSPGPTFVKLFLGRLGVEHEMIERATAEDLVARQKAGKPVKSLIIVTGASLKGMGAAGVSMPEELARTAALIAEARKQGITIVGAHVEGMDRRAQGAAPGDNSDEQSIDAVMPNSSVMVVRQDGNADRRFSVISDTKKIPLVLFEKNMEMGDAFGKVFRK
jgi:hypothetical protein